MKTTLLFIHLIIGLLVASSIFAVETHIMIRAKAVDAKYMGTSVGGARVMVEDAETGELLDQGWINGSTGSTTRIIEQPISRGQALSDNNTAGYLASVDINAPRLLKFTVIGPYAYRQSLQQASVTSWVIPGKHILGDGITLSMPGLIVDAWSQVLAGGKVTLYTKASLLCGCPIYPDGHWDPDNYEAAAILLQDERKVAELNLAFTGPAGMFSAQTTLKQSGHYKAIVYLFDKTTGNVGVDRTMFEINLDSK